MAQLLRISGIFPATKEKAFFFFLLLIFEKPLDAQWGRLFFFTKSIQPAIDKLMEETVDCFAWQEDFNDDCLDKALDIIMQFADNPEGEKNPPLIPTTTTFHNLPS